jgi:sugar phosphate isomerase/epimerase
MKTNGGRASVYSRRDFGRMTFAGLPLSFLAVSSPAATKINGVEIGAITYSFRSIADPGAIIQAMARIGLNEAELMFNHAEALAGAPSVPRGSPTPSQQSAQEALRKWRMSVSMDKFKSVAKKFSDAGIEVRLLCYNMNRNTTDDEIEYAFEMAKALGARAISSTTQVSVAKRIAPFADKHKLMIGYHGHSNLSDPDEFAKPESFAAAMSFSKYHGVNLDIGHFTAANYDAVAYITEHHDRITNLHLKDRKKNQGPNVPWGQGDTPIKEVLTLLKSKKWDIPANIEFEYEGADAVAEVAKCYQFCKDALA